MKLLLVFLTLTLCADEAVRCETLTKITWTKCNRGALQSSHLGDTHQQQVARIGTHSVPLTLVPTPQSTTIVWANVSTVMGEEECTVLTVHMAQFTVVRFHGTPRPVVHPTNALMQRTSHRLYSSVSVPFVELQEIPQRSFFTNTNFSPSSSYQHFHHNISTSHLTTTATTTSQHPHLSSTSTSQQLPILAASSDIHPTSTDNQKQFTTTTTNLHAPHSNSQPSPLSTNVTELPQPPTIPASSLFFSVYYITQYPPLTTTTETFSTNTSYNNPLLHTYNIPPKTLYSPDFDFQQLLKAFTYMMNRVRGNRGVYAQTQKPKTQNVTVSALIHDVVISTPPLPTWIPSGRKISIEFDAKNMTKVRSRVVNNFSRY